MWEWWLPPCMCIYFVHQYHQPTTSPPDFLILRTCLFDTLTMLSGFVSCHVG